jgi:tRNA G18 (ribose-2'-O)-methylase SpoU
VNLIKVESLDEISIKEFLSLKDKSLRESGQLIVETEKVVRKLLKSSCEVSKLFATEEFYSKNWEELKLDKYKCYVADKSLMQEIVGHNLHHGIMALATRPSFSSLEELDDKVLIFNGLTSPENIGTMIRNSAAFNINSVIIDSKTCSPYVRRCIRVSMGNIFRVKVHKTDNLSETISSLKEAGYSIYATANQEKSIDLPQASLKKKGAVIIGSEGHGMEKEIIDICDETLRIPINDEVAHLNAACSSAIVLYQFSLSQ